MLKQFFAFVCLGVSLAGCRSTPTKEGPLEPLMIESYTAADPGFAASSHLILGQKDAILVDAQFLRSEAKKVAEKIKASGRNLKIVFVTHGHPDHYFGLEVLKKEFPSARFVATAKVVADIKETGPAKVEYWKKQYKDDLTDAIVVPDVFSDAELEIDGHRLKIMEFGANEAAHSSALLLVDQKALFAGDLVFNQVHLWLAENRGEAWQGILKELKETGADAVYPGHGAAASPTILDENFRYIETFLKATTGNTTRPKALKRIKIAYPNYRLPIIAELSVAARVKK